MLVTNFLIEMWSKILMWSKVTTKTKTTVLILCTLLTLIKKLVSEIYFYGKSWSLRLNDKQFVKIKKDFNVTYIKYIKIFI